MIMMMTTTGMVFETSVQYGHLRRLIAREDYIKLASNFLIYDGLGEAEVAQSVQ
jgi:hypothetical protein